MKIEKQVAHIQTAVLEKQEKKVIVDTDLSIINEYLDRGFEIQLTIPCFNYYNKGKNIGLKENNPTKLKIEKEGDKYQTSLFLDNFSLNAKELQDYIQYLSAGIQSAQ